MKLNILLQQIGIFVNFIGCTLAVIVYVVRDVVDIRAVWAMTAALGWFVAACCYVKMTDEQKETVFNIKQ